MITQEKDIREKEKSFVSVDKEKKKKDTHCLLKATAKRLPQTQEAQGRNVLTKNEWIKE